VHTLCRLHVAESLQLAELETHESILVSFAGLVRSAASRASGTYVPNGTLLPPEYTPERMYAHSITFIRRDAYTFGQYPVVQLYHEDVLVPCQ
jgi:hypothetical protein